MIHSSIKILIISLAAAIFAVFSANAADGVNNALNTVKGAYATSAPRAIGVRFGYGVSVSYQHGLASGNMVGLDLDIPGFEGIGLTATYDWINPCGNVIPWDNKGEWNWYAGCGLSGGCGFKGFGYLGAAGRLGIEYDFWFPLQLSVDWTPNVGPVFGKNAIGYNTPGLFAGAIAIGVRYKF